MKQLKRISFILIIVILSACSIVDSNSNLSQIVGQWEWTRATGPWVGEVTRDSARGPSHQHRLVFSSDLTFSRFKDDTLQISGEYSVIKNDSEMVVRISHDKGREDYLDVKFQGNDTLILAGKCYDCWTNYYIRDE